MEQKAFLTFKEGDEKSFELVFKAHYNQIVGFCAQFLGDNLEAESVAQEAFIKLWMNRHKLESSNGIISFLYTFAKSGCLNAIRHKKVVSKYNDVKLQEKEDQLNREVLGSFNFDSVELSELEELIQESIESLPDKCREVFVKSRMEGLKNREIADELNISVKAVEANITRALKFISIRLKDYLPAILVHVIIKSL